MAPVVFAYENIYNLIDPTVLRELGELRQYLLEVRKIVVEEWMDALF